jgi:hypothetical protein
LNKSNKDLNVVYLVELFGPSVKEEL